MRTVFLNHDFVQGMAFRDDLRTTAVALLDSQRRLGDVPLRVHPSLPGLETGAGPFIQWANRVRVTTDVDVRSLAEALLRLCSGPFVTDLPVADDLCSFEEQPPLPEDPPWRAEAMRHLALHALFMQGTMACALSYGAGSDLNEAVYRFLLGEQAIEVENFRGHAALAARLDAIESQGLRGAAAVLEAAAARLPGRLVVLDRARDSARRWVLDCSEATLLRALGGLDVYAASLDAGLSREVAARRYYEATSVEMSQESAEVWKSPTCRRQREMDVPGRGKQYFDMHAKPGGSTRIHVWTEKVGAAHVVYVGHCGEHLLLPGGKR